MTADDAREGRTPIDPETWVDRHGDILYRFALMRVGDTSVAEDLVQETLCAAFEARKRFSGRSSERTWLVGILKHKIADHFRRGAREIVVSDGFDRVAGEEDAFDERGRWRSPPAEWGGSPEELLENHEFWGVFQHCLDGLSEGLRRVFSLRELDGLESTEVCKVLDITPTNLWVSLHRARNGLRKCLEKNWFQGTR